MLDGMGFSLKKFIRKPVKMTLKPLAKAPLLNKSKAVQFVLKKEGVIKKKSVSADPVESDEGIPAAAPNSASAIVRSNASRVSSDSSVAVDSSSGSGGSSAGMPTWFKGLAIGAGVLAVVLIATRPKADGK